MDFTYSAEDEAFRKEVQDWLAENLPKIRAKIKSQMGAEASAGADQEGFWEQTMLGRSTSRIKPQQEGSWQREWLKMLGEKGFALPHWPKEYGGGGLSLMQQVVLEEEMSRAAAPPIGNGIAFGFAGPTILTHGTEEQKKRFIPKMISGEELWCQGFSEPDAGSDLASLKTRAVVDGDDYVVNGQKVWSSGAHMADWQILMIRTDPDAPKHRGITYVLMDMHSPGVEVRPLKQMTGNAEFNEIFYDNVRVPKANIVGHENRGWYVAMTTLGFERASGAAGTSFARSVQNVTKLAARTMRNGKPAIEDPVIRAKLAQAAMEAQILVLNGYRTLSARLQGQPPGPQTQMGKLFRSEANQRLTELAANILGTESVLDKGDATARRWQYTFLRAKGNTIEMGTSEILRNIIGERILGLPR